MSDLATTAVIGANAHTISAQSAVTDPLFFLWLVVPLLTALSTSQYATIRDNFYRNLFQSHVKPYQVMIHLFVTDILMSAAITYYIWNFRNPMIGEATDRYVSIEAIWFTIQGVKAIWSVLFWTFGEYMIALGMAMAGVILIVLLCIALFGLFVAEAIVTYNTLNQTSPMPAVLVALVVISYILVAIFNALVIYNKNKDDKEVRLFEQDSQMLNDPQQQRLVVRQDRDYDDRNVYYGSKVKMGMKSAHYNR